MREIRQILAELEMPILSMKEAGITASPEENGETFAANALIKAQAAANALADRTDTIVLADDSGLEVDALNKEPGVHSARYMGEDTPYSVKNQSILERLADVEEAKRTARFVAVIAAVLPDDSVLLARGTIEGRIGHESRGENGFGYDPIFYLPDRDVSTAQLTSEEKNKISHRGRALEQIKEMLREKYGK